MQYRKLFVPRFLDYLDDPNVVVVIQDESIYRSNEYNNFFWQIDRPHNRSTQSSESDVENPQKGVHEIRRAK